MFKKIFSDIYTYKGLRVREFYKNIRGYLIALFLLPILFVEVAYSYYHLDLIVGNPVFYGSWLVGVVVLALVLVVLLVLKLEANVLFFARLRSLWLMRRFLFSHNYCQVEEKTVQRQRKSTTKSKIVYPKVFVKQTKFGVDVYFELQGNAFQEKFLNLGVELETTFGGDFMYRKSIKGYVYYHLAIDRFSSRITVDQVVVDKKGLRLMKDIWWDFDAEPHLLIAGGTGGGKTVVIMTIALALAKIGDVDLCDPKESDLMVLQKAPVLKGRVFAKVDDMIGCLRDNVALMIERYHYMASHPENKIGKNYADYGLRPKFVIFDEWAAFIALLDNDFRKAGEVIQLLTQLILKGRQAGVIVIEGLQRPDGEFIKTALRDNFMKRLSVGMLEDTGYTMLFGDANRNKDFKNIDEINGEKVRGRGYIANAGQMAGEFFAPYVPFDRGFDFLEAFEKLPVLPPDLVTLPESKTSDDKGIKAILDEAKSLPIDSVFEVASKRYTIDGLAKRLDKTFKQVKDVVSMIEQGDYYTFGRDGDGKYSLTGVEADMIIAIVEAKGSSGKRYKAVIAEFFGDSVDSD